MSKTIEIVLTAVDRGLSKGFTAADKFIRKTVTTVKLFNKTANNGIRIMGGLESAIGGVAGAYLGLQGISSVGEIMEKGSNAAFSLEASLKAANRQFSNTGSMQEWQASIGRLSKQLQIYSENDLKLAAASTVDMTKRLGLTSQQMEQLIRLTGDLSAGRTDLAGGIERVTAAMRGEAEASEYLGLTLNENYVKAWHEANNATGQAWKDLTDLEKVQVRYQVFLEQALPTQGKAAESVASLGGAWQMTRTQIENAISSNTNVNAAVSELSAMLTENSEAIGNLVGNMVSWAATMMEVALRHKDMSANVGKFVAALYLLGKAGQVLGVLINYFSALNKVCAILTKRSIGKWAKDTVFQMRTVQLGAMSLKGAISSLFAVFAAWEIGTAIGDWLNQFDVVKKAGVTFAHTLTMTWLKLKQVWASMPWVDGSMAARVREEIAAAKMTYKEMMQSQDHKSSPAKSSEKKEAEKTTPFPAVQPQIAPHDMQFDQVDVPEQAGVKDDPDNVLGRRGRKKVAREKPMSFEERYGLTGKDVAAGMAQAMNAKINNVWTQIEDGSIKGAANIKNALQSVAGKHQVKSVEVYDSKPSKKVELRFKGGSLQGSQGDVDALLRELEQAGMTA